MGLFCVQFLLFMLAAHIGLYEQCYRRKKVDQMSHCLLQAALFSATEHCKALPSADLPKIAEQQLVPTVVVDSQSYGAVGRPPPRLCPPVGAVKPVTLLSNCVETWLSMDRWVMQFRQVEKAGCTSGTGCSFYWAGLGVEFPRDKKLVSCVIKSDQR